MEQASEPKRPGPAQAALAAVASSWPGVAIRDRVLTAEVRWARAFKGYQSFLIRDLFLRPVAIRYRREPLGWTLTAAR